MVEHTLRRFTTKVSVPSTDSRVSSNAKLSIPGPDSVSVSARADDPLLGSPHDTATITTNATTEAALTETAADFDISTSTLKRWMAQADIDDGIRDGHTSAEHDELVQLRRRNRRLEQEVEILRRATAYFAKDAAPK